MKTTVHRMYSRVG